jgi:rhodanese-related sulfurtransferase
VLKFLKKIYKEISPKELSERMKEKKLNLIDCRNEDELTIASVKGFINIPMHEVPSRMSEFNKDEDNYIMCRSGQRSAEVCRYLHQNGVGDVYNVTGGILAWADEVDSSIQKY